MLIHRLHVKNFRSIQDESLRCDSLTALVGPNGSGKSSFLNALELFYSPSSKVKPQDFYSEDTTLTIEIAITFSNLNENEKKTFSAYLDKGLLTIVRIFSDPTSGKTGTYHGIRLQNLKFIDVRTAGPKMAIRKAYNELRKESEFSSLPSARSADAALDALAEWENNNPARCSRLRDDGQFFGFTQVARGYLGRHTRFISIPAVRDALEDATEKKGSSVTEIMDLVVRSALLERDEVAAFEQQIQSRYRDVLDPERLPELSNLADELSGTIQSYVPSAGIRLQWHELPDIRIPLPQAQVKLVEDGYEANVELTGHGLQRIFIITMLQHLETIRHVRPPLQGGGSVVVEEEDGDASSQAPSLMLAIEEPELYQHPSRQRHLASVLLNLATSVVPGVAEHIQVIYATHSPILVGLDRFDGIRVLRKVDPGGEIPRVTQLRAASMESVADELREVTGQQHKFTADTLRPRLQAIMTPWMNEGFFAGLVVLVEGEQDRAAILGVAKANGSDIEAMDISVIPCFGKTNLDRPLIIFRQLGIPVYVVWDSDHGSNDSRPEDNRYLLRLVQEPEEDWPHFVRGTAACFKSKLEDTLAEELGRDLFDNLITDIRKELGIRKRRQAIKNPTVMRLIIDRAASNGMRSVTLEKVVRNIIAAKNEADMIK